MTRAETVSGYINGENDAVEALDGSAVDDAGGGGHVVMDDGTFATVDCTVAREISSMVLTFVGDEGKLYFNNDDGEWCYWNLVDGEHIEESLLGIESGWTWEDDYENAFPNAARHIFSLLDNNAENRSPGVEVPTRLKSSSPSISRTILARRWMCPLIAPCETLPSHRGDSTIVG